ncbi:MAG: hypothetical protein PHG14_08635 [Desulfobacter postgatei]|uniref:hypothetical protein n=1 Tax=Desulfobacter postgatei TaxID=2293 RepID=UPI0023F4B502|nr:hypothetical protein [Desulfobacter postgatei]MDD4273779.1 hypothetical protein [Desulfobacter postgatei]
MDGKDLNLFIDFKAGAFRRYLLGGIFCKGEKSFFPCPVPGPFPPPATRNGLLLNPDESMKSSTSDDSTRP